MLWGAVIAYCKHFGSMILLRNAVTTTIAAQMQIKLLNYIYSFASWARLFESRLTLTQD